MPNTTGLFSQPYPNSSAVPDVPGDILLLAQSVDDDLSGQVAEWRVADSTARAALTGMREGDRALQIDTDITYRYNGSSWAAWSSPWISYTPTLFAVSGSFAVGTGGNAFNTGEYKYTDGDLHIRGRVVLGTSGQSMATSQPSIGMPSGIALRAPLIANENLFGRATLFDTGVAVNGGWVRYLGTATDRFEIQQNAATAAGAAGITSTSPWTWGAGDALEYDLFAKVA